jgi:hypothetical protein
LFARLFIDIYCIPISNTTNSLNRPNHPNPIFWYLYWMPFCWMVVGLAPYAGYCALTGLGVVVLARFWIGFWDLDFFGFFRS